MILMASDSFPKFQCIFDYLQCRKLELEPQHPWMLRNPKTSLRYASLIRDRPGVGHIFHLIFAIHIVFDHSPLRPWSHLKK